MHVPRLAAAFVAVLFAALLGAAIPQGFATDAPSWAGPHPSTLQSFFVDNGASRNRVVLMASLPRSFVLTQVISSAGQTITVYASGARILRFNPFAQITRIDPGLIIPRGSSLEIENSGVVTVIGYWAP